MSKIDVKAVDCEVPGAVRPSVGGSGDVGASPGDGVDVVITAAAERRPPTRSAALAGQET